MMFFAPARPTLHAIDGGVEAILPAPRRSPLLLVLPLWLCGWLPAGLHSLVALAAPDAGAEAASLAFALPWLIVWALGVLAAVGMLLWTCVGVQRVRITRERLTLSHEMLRLQWRRAYRVGDVGHLRAIRPAMLLAGSGPVSEPCKIAFDHGERTVRFAAGIDDHEAIRLVDAIRSRAPWLDSQRKPK